MKKRVIFAILALFGVAIQSCGAIVTTYRADSEQIRWVGRVDVTPEG